MANIFKAKTLVSRTGIFSHQAIAPNLVYNTGNQTISGNKSFYGDVLLSGNNNRIGKHHYIETSDDHVFIKDQYNDLILSSEEYILFYDQVGSVSWGGRTLNDSLGQDALNWDNRNLINKNGSPVLYWTGDNIGIGTNTPTEKLQVDGNIIANNLVYNTGNQNISGVKTFAENAVFGDPSQGDFLVISGNTFTVYGSGNFINGLFVSGVPVLTGVNLSSYATTANLALTESTLDTKINNLSGVSVLTFGDQTISGIKTFNDRLIAKTGFFGQNNILSGSFLAIAGGINNFITGNNSFIGGGCANRISGNNNFIGGGCNNSINRASNASIVAGNGNVLDLISNCSFIGGGASNRITQASCLSVIGGGFSNCAACAAAVVGGGCVNRALGDGAVIVGGCQNTASRPGAFVGGGCQNCIESYAGTIGGGFNNWSRDGNSNFIGGGGGNQVRNDHSTVGGGQLNYAHSIGSSILGGLGNQIDGNSPVSSIVGGCSNCISYTLGGTIGGGRYNCITSSPIAVIGGGCLNKICGAANSYIVGGYLSNILDGHSGSAILADGQDRVHNSSGAHTLTLDFASGVYFASPRIYGSLTFNSPVNAINGLTANSGVFSFQNAIPSILPNNPLSIVGSGNTYIQVNIQNRATGTRATADLVITANNGTDNSNFINLGINNSGYNDPAFSNGTGLDGYLFINGGSLDIGTQTPGTSVEFHVGGTTSNNSILRVTSSGIDLSSGCNIYGANNYQRITADFTTTAAPSARLSFNLESGKVYTMDQYFRFTTPGSIANSSSQTTTSPGSSVFADGYKMGINNQSTFLSTSMIFVGDNNNAVVSQGMLGEITGTAHHFRKGILRPNQNATINFLAGSHNGASTTLGLGSYVLIQKLT